MRFRSLEEWSGVESLLGFNVKIRNAVERLFSMVPWNTKAGLLSRALSLMRNGSVSRFRYLQREVQHGHRDRLQI